MGFWSRVAQFASKQAGDVNDDRAFGFWDGSRSNAGVDVNSITAMRHVACMACVSILAATCAKIPFDIYRRLPDGGKEVFKDHPLHRLMRNPNNWQTGFEFKEMLQASLVLRGNGYAPSWCGTAAAIRSTWCRSTLTGSGCLKRRAASTSMRSRGTACTRWRCCGSIRC